MEACTLLENEKPSRGAWATQTHLLLIERSRLFIRSQYFFINFYLQISPIEMIHFMTSMYWTPVRSKNGHKQSKTEWLFISIVTLTLNYIVIIMVMIAINSPTISSSFTSITCVPHTFFVCYYYDHPLIVTL